MNVTLDETTATNKKNATTPKDRSFVLAWWDTFPMEANAKVEYFHLIPFLISPLPLVAIY